MKRYIKDVFDIDKVVSEHGNKIFLIAGVGSGKSTWVKETLSQKGSVLFITSRKAKVLEDSKCSSFSEVFKWYTDGNQTLLTNAKLAKLIEVIIDNPQKELNDFIAHFDYIVIDEVHSIATDSTYALHCPNVLSFIDYVSNAGKIVVCMTGTPEPIEYYFKEHNWFFIDYRKVCTYVHPQKILLSTTYSLYGLVQNNWGINPIIYFANRTDTMITLCNELLESGTAQPEEIALIVAKSKEKEFYTKLSKKIKQTSFNKIKKSSEQVYDSIINTQLLPDTCKILFSTSVLREGIDIHNESIVMFCENHVLSNIIQFYGRARNNSTLYVLEDVFDHNIACQEVIYEYGYSNEVQCANNFLVTRINDDKNPFSHTEKKQLIQHVQNNPYLYFDYIDDTFKIFHMRYIEEQRLANNISWKSDLLSYCQEYGIDFEGCMNMKKTMQEALQQAFERGLEIPLDYKPTIFNMLRWAYGITDETPKNISKNLAHEKANYRLINGKWNSAQKRGKSYWKFVSIEEYDIWLSKQAKE